MLVPSDHYVMLLGMASLLLPEQPTINSASSLLVTFITLSSSVDIIAKILDHRGKELVQCLLKCIAGDMDRSQLDLVSNVLSTLVQYSIEDLAIWFKVGSIYYMYIGKNNNLLCYTLHDQGLV